MGKLLRNMVTALQAVSWTAEVDIPPPLSRPGSTSGPSCPSMRHRAANCACHPEKTGGGGAGAAGPGRRRVLPAARPEVLDPARQTKKAHGPESVSLGTDSDRARRASRGPQVPPPARRLPGPAVRPGRCATADPGL